MALNDSEEKRIQSIEQVLSKHSTAIRNLASKRQLNHILALLTQQLETIQTELASIQSQIEALKK
jgi:hypothetical protein